MIAAFLKNDDGTFNYPAALVAVFFAFAICWQFIHLFKALKNGRILFGIPRGLFRVRWVYQNNNALGFWAAFIIHFLGLLLFIWLIFVICFGMLQN